MSERDDPPTMFEGGSAAVKTCLETLGREGLGVLKYLLKCPET